MSDMTVGELRRKLEGFDDDATIICSGGLTIYRVKRWGDDEALIEFSEIQAELSPAFKRKHPEVIVAFARFESDGSIVQEVRVPRL